MSRDDARAVTSEFSGNSRAGGCEKFLTGVVSSV